MKNEKLAQDAWAKLFDSQPELANEKDLSIILDVIEQADLKGYRRAVDQWQRGEWKDPEPAAQPQRSEHYVVDDDTGKTEGPFTDNELMQKLHGAASSEPQEWTQAIVHQMLVDHGETAVALAHEAALAAEHRKYEGMADHMEACRELLGVPEDDVLYGSIEEIQKQLAAERDWHEQAGKQLDEVHRDLLVERDKLRGVTAGFEQVLLELAAEREKRKPLMQALEAALSVGEIRFGTCTLSRDVKAKIDAALAKAKGKP